MTQQPTIIFFVDGPSPSAANVVAANALRGDGAIVNFRNARFVAPSIDNKGEEVCDGVAGAVPDSYSAAPSAATAIAAYKAALVSDAAAIVDTAALLAAVPAAPAVPAPPAFVPGAANPFAPITPAPTTT